MMNPSICAVANSPGNQYVGPQAGQAQMGQYSGSQGSLYGSSGSIYGQSSQYAANQYGSNGSINQYAQVVQPQYAAAATAVATPVQSSPYGMPANAVNQYHVGNGGYAPAVGNSAGPPPPPPGAIVNAYAPIGSAAQQQPARNAIKGGFSPAPPPPPPPPAPEGARGNGAVASPGQQGGGDCTPVADTNSLAAALQAARLKKKQVGGFLEGGGVRGR